MEAIALFPFVITKQKVKSCSNELILHEKIHLYQQVELLIVGFYLIYILHYVYNLFKYKNRYQAYRNIVFEKEAYENDQIDDYLQHRVLWAFNRYW